MGIPIRAGHGLRRSERRDPPRRRPSSTRRSCAATWTTPCRSDAASSRAGGRWPSSGSSQLALERVRRAADADHVFFVSRRPLVGRRDSRAHARRVGTGGRAGPPAGGARPRRRAAAVQRALAHRARRDQPGASAACRRGCSPCSDRCCLCWSRSASTRSWPTRCRCTRRRSACVARSVRPCAA